MSNCRKIWFRTLVVPPKVLHPHVTLVLWSPLGCWAPSAPAGSFSSSGQEDTGVVLPGAACARGPLRGTASFSGREVPACPDSLATVMQAAVTILGDNPALGKPSAAAFLS